VVGFVRDRSRRISTMRMLHMATFGALALGVTFGMVRPANAG
jgi:hypothetical protein